MFSVVLGRYWGSFETSVNSLYRGLVLIIFSVGWGGGWVGVTLNREGTHFYHSLELCGRGVRDLIQTERNLVGVDVVVRYKYKHGKVQDL